MVYATYARGYKPRAFNTAQTLTSDNALAPVRKESINDFEVGAKASFLDGALSLNAAAFSTSYRDYQVQIYDNSSVVSLLVLSNAGEARTRGLELDATLNASSSTVVNFSGAYIDAQFVNYTGAPCYPTQTEAQGCTVDANGSTQDLSGRPMPDSPKFKLTLNVDQSLPEDLLPWSVRLNGNYAYRTSANFQADNNPHTVQKGFGILNLGATFTSPSGRHAVATFVNNVTNRFYLVNAEDFFSGLWNANAVIGQPARDARRYVGVKYNLYFD
jgi:iron complex outermembrane receptor protein